jgi:hypothetical protein
LFWNFSCHKKGLENSLVGIDIVYCFFIGGNTYRWLWTLANISAAIIFVSTIQLFLNFINKSGFIFKSLIFIGSLSMYVFACHGILRTGFIQLANYLSSPFSSLAISIIYLIVSIAIAFLLMQIEKFMRSQLKYSRIAPFKIMPYCVILIILISSFGIIYFENNRIPIEIDNQLSNAKYKLINNFENTLNIDSNRLDTFHFSGNKSLILPAHESFSPPLEISFDTIDVKGIFEAKASAMIYTNDMLAECNMVLEIANIKTGQTMEWKSVSKSREEFIENKWQQINFNFRIPSFYLNPSYKIRVYLWNNSKGSFYADDLKLEI